jgi:hypothetical protein
MNADLASHLAIEHTVESFNEWVWNLSRFGHRVQATAACAAADASVPVWMAYDGADAAEWHRGRSTAQLADLLGRWLDDPDVANASALRSLTARLAGELESMCVYVDEASGPATVCDRRERTLAAARAILAAGRAAIWTPAMVARIEDTAEYRAQVAAGPALETVDCCRLAACAIGTPNGHAIVALAVRRALARRFR